MMQHQFVSNIESSLCSKTTLGTFYDRQSLKTRSVEQTDFMCDLFYGNVFNCSTPEFCKQLEKEKTDLDSALISNCNRKALVT